MRIKGISLHKIKSVSTHILISFSENTTKFSSQQQTKISKMVMVFLDEDHFYEIIILSDNFKLNLDQ